MKGLPTHPNPLLHHWRFPDGVPEPNLWYRFCRRFCHVTFTSLWKVQVCNRHYEPAAGSALYISNHQSFLDPVLIGLALKRPMNYMARDSLFAGGLFKPLIESLGAFPVRRGAADTAALKEALRRLKRGEQLTIFPEGTRTRDGRVGPFLPGVAMLARRTAEWTIPVVIDGAFECWPRSRRLPGPGRITVAYGRPVSRDEMSGMEAKGILARIRGAIIDLQADVRQRMGRPALRYEREDE